MGIYIKIEKYKENNEIGYYIVSTQDFGGAYFYIGINKKLKKVYLYSSKNLKTNIGEINCAKNDEPINLIDGIQAAIIGRVIIKAMQAFEKKFFPDFLSYEA